MNRRLPRPARLLLRAACTLFALALLYLLAAAALGCVRLNTARPPVAESRITIYLLRACLRSFHSRQFRDGKKAVPKRH